MFDITTVRNRTSFPTGNTPQSVVNVTFRTDLVLFVILNESDQFFLSISRYFSLGIQGIRARVHLNKSNDRVNIFTCFVLYFEVSTDLKERNNCDRPAIHNDFLRIYHFFPL